MRLGERGYAVGLKAVYATLLVLVLGGHAAVADETVALDDPAVEHVYQELLAAEVQRAGAVDTVTLVTGKVFRGRVIEQTETSVRFENTRGIKISLPAARVASVKRGEPTPPSAARRTELRTEARKKVALFRESLTSPVTLDLESTKVAALVKFLAEVTKIPITVDPSLGKKRISLKTREQPLRAVLELIAERAGGRLVLRHRSATIVR